MHLLQKYNFSRTLRKVCYTLSIYLRYVSLIAYQSWSSSRFIACVIKADFSPIFDDCSICDLWQEGRKIYRSRDPRELFRRNFILCCRFCRAKTLVEYCSRSLILMSNISKSIYWCIRIYKIYFLSRFIYNKLYIHFNEVFSMQKII